MAEPRMDNQRLDALWREVESPVTAYIAALVPDRDEAMDVKQRAAVAMVRKIHEYDAQRPFLPWVLGMVRYEVLRWRRDRATKMRFVAQRMLDRYESPATALSDIPATDLEQAIRACLAEAPAASVQLLTLRYNENLKAVDIAERLNMTPRAVFAKLHRVRSRLKQCIEQRLKLEG